MEGEEKRNGTDSEQDEDPIPLSALQHAVYCLRQAALIHLERLWAENRFTAEGQVLHLAAHESGQRRTKGLRPVTALPIASRRLGIAGSSSAPGPEVRRRIRLSSSAARPNSTAPTRSSSARKPL